MGQNNFDQFKEIADQDLVRQKDLGKMNFQEAAVLLDDLKRLLTEMIEIIEEEENIPQGLKNNVNTYVVNFNQFAQEIHSYQLENDRDFRNRQTLINNIKNYYKSIYDSRQNNKDTSHFLPTFNALKNLRKSNVENISSDFKKIKKEYESAKSKYENLIDTVSSEAAKETLSDYAEIFSKQSERHSQIKRWKIGSAEIFFILGVILSVILICFLLSSFLSVGVDVTTEQAIAIILRKFLFLSFLAFSIKFCFKQFSINKHLSTQNQHRANALNSFKLFNAGLHPEDEFTKKYFNDRISEVNF